MQRLEKSQKRKKFVTEIMLENTVKKVPLPSSLKTILKRIIKPSTRLQHL